MNKIFAEILKEKRISEGLTQEQLAKKVGLCRNAIWNYENESREPKIRVLKKLAKALNTSVDDLIGEIEL
jgi:transcriptional regulator with XRE-family HTH domain